MRLLPCRNCRLRWCTQLIDFAENSLDVSLRIIEALVQLLSSSFVGIIKAVQALSNEGLKSRLLVDLVNFRIRFGELLLNSIHALVCVSDLIIKYVHLLVSLLIWSTNSSMRLWFSLKAVSMVAFKSACVARAVSSTRLLVSFTEASRSVICCLVSLKPVMNKSSMRLVVSS
jgi:hypothetical protein